MGAEIPATFCPNCLCPACVAHSRMLWENQQEMLADLEAIREKIEQRKAAEAARYAELMQQSAMIWMLTNLAQDAGDVKTHINEIAAALDLSSTMVNARRNIYVVELNKRAGIEDNFQWKPPGTRGMEEPSWCDKCGGMKTKGRSCRRRSCR